MAWCVWGCGVVHSGQPQCRLRSPANGRVSTSLLRVWLDGLLPHHPALPGHDGIDSGGESCRPRLLPQHSLEQWTFAAFTIECLLPDLELGVWQVFEVLALVHLLVLRVAQPDNSSTTRLQRESAAPQHTGSCLQPAHVQCHLSHHKIFDKKSIVSNGCKA